LSYDVVIIGSGFGGAVSACRLANAGRSVLVLERGRRWTPATYPRQPEDAWVWEQSMPEVLNGWIDLRFLKNMWVAQGAGVGGGSLIYANISINAKPEAFNSGWPSQINYQVLEPYYERVRGMLDSKPLPDGQLTKRFLLMREAAEKTGNADRFRKLDLAVTFDENFTPDPDAIDSKNSKTFTNRFGKQQGTCYHCGNCDIGCDVSARNTLDLNYIADAERAGATVQPLSMVTHISRDGDGWRVHYDRLANGRREPAEVVAKRVVLGAGSLGSTEILLRSRDQYGTLPTLSKSLGRGWSSNGDFLTPAFYGDGRRVDYRVVSPGIDGLHEADGILDCGNSGTTTRLIAGILAGLPGYHVLDGDDSLRRRPLARIIEPLRAMGAEVHARRANSLLPMTVVGHSPLRNA